MSNLAQDIASDINSAMQEDQLELPTLPEVALRIRDEAEREMVNAASLAAVVSEDPGLATQLVRIANSPLFRATRSIDDLAQAIGRLGVEYSANLVTGLAMKQMFQATSDMLDRKMRMIWKQSTEIAAWSAMLAKRCKHLRADQATLAGLTHCIGALPIMAWAEEHDHLLRDSMTLDRVIDAIHPTIGTMILRQWNFAEELIAVPENYHREDYQPDQPNRSDYVDLVFFSTTARKLHVDGEIAGSTWPASSAYGRLGFNADMDNEDISELAAQVADVNGVIV